MALSFEKREAFQALGGVQTVLLGTVYLLLALGALAAILLFSESASRENASALRLERSVGHLHVLLRGLNEIVVTQGSSASREIVKKATQDFEATRATLATEERSELSIGWEGIQGGTAKLLGLGNVTVDNDALIALGKTSSGIEKLVAAASARADSQRTRAADADRRSNIVIVAAALVVLLGTLAIFLAFHRNVTRPVESAIGVAREVAGGDLTARDSLQRKGQAGRLLTTLGDMREQLGALVGNVRNGTETIDRAATELASGNEDLSERTQRQATALEETAASIEELTAAVSTNASSARLANEKAARARDTATKGGDVVGKFLGKMESIQEGSRRMAEIIGVIDSIAFQTNILALNAAVEAARAGEQGRGFAVVASEVRALAQRTATAAREIKTLIEGSSSQIAEGGRMVESSREIMREIETSIDEVSHLVLAISQASTEQTSGIRQASATLVQMEQMVQENAALVERNSSASQALRDQAGSLKNAVSVFRLERGFDTAAPAERPGRQLVRATAAEEEWKQF